jgi:tetratricopeptide (TPR) repeat protein
MVCGVLVLMLSACKPAGPREFLDGKRLLESGDVPAAILKFETARSLLQTNEQVWNYLGVAYHRAGRVEDAADAYLNALKLNPDLTIVHYNLGCLYLEGNRPDLLEKAQNEFVAYVLRQQRNPEGWLKLGVAQMRLAHLQPAEASFHEVLVLNPQNVEALNNLGVVQLHRRHYQDASGFFAKSLAVQPGYASALQNYATCQLYLNNRPLALQKFREYMQLKPQPLNAPQVAAMVLQLEKELETPNPNVSTSQSSSVALSKSNSPTVVQTKNQPPSPPRTDSTQNNVRIPNEPARATVAQIDSIKVQNNMQPTIPSNTFPKADTVVVQKNESVTPGKTPKKSLLQRLNPISIFGSETKPTSGNFPVPTATFTPLPESATLPETRDVRLQVSRPKVITPLAIPNGYPYLANPKPAAGNRAEAQSWFDRGEESRRDRRVRDAITSYVKAAESDPSFFDVQMALGTSSLDVNDVPQALRAYEIACAIKPDSFNARYGFGLSLKKANYIRDAAEQLEKTITISGASPVQLAAAHLALANLYADLFHQPASARPHYAKVLELDPSNPQSTSIRYWMQNNP